MDKENTIEEKIEELAELEHEQWIAWSKELSKHQYISQVRQERWKKLWKPYSELTEEEKEQDRVYARKLLPILHDIRRQALEDVEELILKYKEDELRGDYSDVHFAENEINRKLIDWIIEDINKLSK